MIAKKRALLQIDTDKKSKPAQLAQDTTVLKEEKEESDKDEDEDDMVATNEASSIQVIPVLAGCSSLLCSVYHTHGLYFLLVWLGTKSMGHQADCD